MLLLDLEDRKDGRLLFLFRKLPPSFPSCEATHPQVEDVNQRRNANQDLLVETIEERNDVLVDCDDVVMIRLKRAQIVDQFESMLSSTLTLLLVASVPERNLCRNPKVLQ